MVEFSRLAHNSRCKIVNSLQVVFVDPGGGGPERGTIIQHAKH